LVVFAHINYVMPHSALENHVFFLLGPYLALMVHFRPIGDESLTFCQTFQFRLEPRLIGNNYA